MCEPHCTFWLKGLDPIWAAKQDKPHVLLIAGLHPTFVSGSGVLSCRSIAAAQLRLVLCKGLAISACVFLIAKRHW